MTNVRTIIFAYLKSNGYDGLYHDNDCGCELDDLVPCGEDPSQCVPGHYVPCDAETCEAGGGCPWHIGEKR